MEEMIMRLIGTHHANFTIIDYDADQGMFKVRYDTSGTEVWILQDSIGHWEAKWEDHQELERERAIWLSQFGKKQSILPLVILGAIVVFLVGS
jgi:hypothetical protein